jgi:RNA polymerase sigma factor (sigma-70 family)
MKSKITDQEVQFQNLHQDLIDACRRFDQKAQFRIYKLYYKAMYNASLRIVHNTMEAEDIMQESFLTAFEKINSYSGSVSFGSWLRKIVKNQSIDFLNKKNILVYNDIEAYHDIEDTAIEIGAFENENDPRTSKVMSIIKNLPEKYRNIISLYLFEGYDHEEISEILSIPSSTSRSSFSRARSRIIAEFAE